MILNLKLYLLPLLSLSLVEAQRGIGVGSINANVPMRTVTNNGRGNGVVTATTPLDNGRGNVVVPAAPGIVNNGRGNAPSPVIVARPAPQASNPGKKDSDWFATGVIAASDRDRQAISSGEQRNFVRIADILANCPNIQPERLSPLANYTDGGSDQKVEVDIQFLPKFIDIMEVEESIALSGLLKITWVVECESRNLQRFRHINLGSVRTEGCCRFSDVWLPPVFHDNAKSNFAIMDGYDHDLVIKPVSGENGKVLLHFSWYRFGIFAAECPMEMANFPFDSQTCSFTFSPKFSHIGTIAFRRVVNVNKINMESTDSWELIESSVNIVDLVEVGDRGTAEFSYTFKRKHNYFVNNILLPAFGLGFLGEIAAFALPADSPDRPTFSVTVLISLTYIHGIVLSSIPKTTESVFINDFTLMHGIHSLIISVYFTVMCWFCDAFQKSMHRNMIRYKREVIEEDEKDTIKSTWGRIQWLCPFPPSSKPSAMKLYRFIDAIMFILSAFFFLGTSIWAIDTFRDNERPVSEYSILCVEALVDSTIAICSI